MMFPLRQPHHLAFIGDGAAAAAHDDNDDDIVSWVRAGGGTTLHEEHLPQEVLRLCPAQGAAAAGVVRYGGHKGVQWTE